jgi:hypothetical protein
MRGCGFLALLSTVVLLLAGVQPAASVAQAVDPKRVAAVKAAYVINFLRYTHWPESRRGAPYTVTVVGDDAVADALAADARLPSVVARGGLDVRRVRYPRPAADGALGTEQRARFLALLQGSHLVYIGADERDRLPDILEAIRAEPVLTVSDVPGFAGAGGMLELVRAGRTIAFVANPDAIQTRGLLVSAKVLKLARELRGGAR